MSSGSAREASGSLLFLPQHTHTHTLLPLCLELGKGGTRAYSVVGDTVRRVGLWDSSAGQRAEKKRQRLEGHKEFLCGERGWCVCD